MSPSLNPLRLVWVDLEMTGLNPDHDTILEIAVVITGADLKPVAEIEHVVFQTPEALQQMSRVVRKLHTDNGLIDDVGSKGIDARTAESDVLRILAENTQPGQAMLCGRSVHHDWKFLVKYMPRIEQHLHFARLDVSTISVLLEEWFPNAPRYEAPPTHHRAMADVRAGIAEMRHYCENVLNIDFSALAARTAGAT